MKSAKFLAAILLSVATPALASSPSTTAIKAAEHKVAQTAGASLSGFSHAIAYAGTANGGKDIRVVAYRHAPGMPAAYLVSRKTNRVRMDSVNPPSSATLNKAAKNLLAKE
jgi:hypothetical protein